ncbi:MAG: FAD-dependent oxidoreductase [Thermoleophilia bacterium]|nr:FAD-dependent oxidoreductase [Thermoleophilia bacterium]
MAVVSFLCLLGLAPYSAPDQVVAKADVPLDVDSYDTIKSDTPGPESAGPGTTEAKTGEPGTTGPEGTEPDADAGAGDDGDAADALPTVDVDVVVYATQTSGLAAVRELALGAPHLRVALISCGNLLETPLTQGLSVEDARNIDTISGGFYDEWREGVIRSYALMGRKAFSSSGRFVYEPEVAATVLWKYVTGDNAPNAQFYSAKLLAAGDEAEKRYVDIQVEGTGPLRLNTKYFIDASVEGDLARMLGADYRIGRDEVVYNDVAGNRPTYPNLVNGYSTAPQRFSALLTLKVYASGTAPRVAGMVHPNYNPDSYAGMTFASKHVAAFNSSWSMRIATLPNGKRELNETWSDWPDIGLAFQWVFEPDKRGEIRKRVLEWSINRVRYLQEHGYPRVGIASIPQKLYVREGPRVVGLDTYTVDDLRNGFLRDPVAIGCYCEYDRHDAFAPNHIETTRCVYMPMQALMAADHPALLVSTAVSTDCATYSSAVRMEHTRANMGAAAAMILIAADLQGVEPTEVSYETVRTLLLTRGYQVN